MAGVRAEHQGAALGLDRIAEVRVRIGCESVRDGTEHEVFLLDLPISADASAPADERLLEALGPVLRAVPTSYSIHVDKSWTNRGTGSLALRAELADLEPARFINQVAESLRSIRASCGDPPGPDLHRDDALTRARVRVASAYPRVHSETLSVTDERCVSRESGWHIGLETPQRERFTVRVGFLDGYAASAHVLHQLQPEVIDSLGSY